MSFSQLSLAAAYVASTYGTYIALSPPNPRPADAPPTTDQKGQPIRDSMHMWKFTHNHFAKFMIIPFALLSSHAASLAYKYPNLPPALLGHGAQNLNKDLITWSPSTAIPLALLFFVGVPLRLIPYRHLGKNFTFALTKPSGLRTTGIYAHMQHPSYTAVVVLVLCNIALLARLDGVLGCWIRPDMVRTLTGVEMAGLAIGGCLFLTGVGTRVVEEEAMLKEEFKEDWVRWHAKTARFIPWVI
ncbi:hypothetical protein COL922a_012028 [Colletotrichum nupharicola]|nr:hypothetical protein COL922a_012028 [Colletotrichum nupharicola]